MQVAKNADSQTGHGAQAEDSLTTTTLMLMGVLIGAIALAVVLPVWVPRLETQATVSELTLYSHLSRASGFTAFGLMWMSMAFGLILIRRDARVWRRGPTALEMHEYTSLLGLGFALLHGSILLGEPYDLAGVLVPFAGSIWVGFGQLALYGLALVSLTFYARKRIGEGAWRLVHYGSYGMFALALLHGIFSGSNTGTSWSGLIYWFAGASLAVLTVYRMLVTRSARHGRGVG